MTNNREKKLLINTFIFAIGNIGSKIISFIIVPLYTIYMTKIEYGYSDTLLVYSNLLLPIFSLSLAEAVLRFTLTSEERTEKVFFSAFIVICFNSLVLIIGSYFLHIIFNDTIPFIYLSLFIVSQMLYAFVSQFSKGIEKNLLFSSSSILLSCFLLVLSFVFLQNLNNKIVAFFLSQIISYFCTSIFLMYKLKITKYLQFEFWDKVLLKRMLRYSIPLIPNLIMWWVMNASSRLFIVYYQGYESSGLYAVASKIPTLLSVLSSVFLQSWQISAVEENDSKDKEIFYSLVFSKLTDLLIITVSLLFLTMKIIMYYFVSDSFFLAWKFVPLLLVGLIFSNLSQFVGMTYLATMKTKGSLITTIFGAVISLVLNFSLIPIFGPDGASISLGVSFFIVLLVRLIDTRKLIPINIEYKKYIPLVILVILQAVVCMNDLFMWNLIIFIIIIIILRKNIKALFMKFIYILFSK